MPGAIFLCPSAPILNVSQLSSSRGVFVLAVCTVTCFPSLSSKSLFTAQLPGTLKRVQGSHLHSPTSCPDTLSGHFLSLPSPCPHVSLSPPCLPPGLPASKLLSGCQVSHPVVGADPPGSPQGQDNPQGCWEPGQGHRAATYVTSTCLSERSLLGVRCFLGISGITEMTHSGIHPMGISNLLGEIEALAPPRNTQCALGLQGIKASPGASPGLVLKSGPIRALSHWLSSSSMPTFQPPRGCSLLLLLQSCLAACFVVH